MSALPPEYNELNRHPLGHDVNTTVRNLEPMLRRTLPENIDFQSRLAEDLPKVHADSLTVGQVLVNLVQNARDAILFDGAITIRTSKIQLDQLSCNSEQAYPGDFVCLEVEDNGTGIPADELPRIFDPFFTTKNGGMATGLGLYVVDAIVKQHGGWVQVDTSVGRGTTFAVFLPTLLRTPK